jgi:nucleolar protein 12
VPVAPSSKRSDRRKAANPDEDLSAQSDEEKQERMEMALTKKKKKKKIVPADPEEEKRRAERTVFVGGVPVAVAKTDRLAKYFSKFGKVESVRFRSIAMAQMSNPQMRRVGFIKGQFNEKQETCNAYVVFADKASLPLALVENGKDDFAEGFHLRVDTLEPTISHKKSVFVGNLPFDVADRLVREAFAVSAELLYAISVLTQCRSAVLSTTCGWYAMQ